MSLLLKAEAKEGDKKKRRNLIVEEERVVEVRSSGRWLIYKTCGGGNVTGRVMVRSSLKDYFVFLVSNLIAQFCFLFSPLFSVFLPQTAFLSSFFPPTGRISHNQ